MLRTQTTLRCTASYVPSLLSFTLIYYPSSVLGVQKLFTEYGHHHCNQVAFVIARHVLRPNYDINMTCNSDFCTGLLLAMTSPHPNDAALNST